MTIKIFRGAATGKLRHWTGGRGDLHPNPSDQAVVLEFKINASRGETGLLLQFDGDSFEELAKTMIAAKPTAAIKAFGAALLTFGPNSED